LVVIGGDGSAKGALSLSNHGIPVIAIPATIDLDINCTEYTIGFDTAVNTGMTAVNRLRDTSGSHERVSVVEVMGRGAGFLAMWTGITGGAEDVLIPEDRDNNNEAVTRQIIMNRGKGKTHNLIIVTEHIGGAEDLAKQIEDVTGIEARATILGHLQRGGAPTASDRMHASMMGHMAVDLILNDKLNRMVIMKNGAYADIDLAEALKQERTYDKKMYDILKILAI